MSVAIGMPHPAAPLPPTFSTASIPAGTDIPPSAAATDSAAFLGSASSPTVTSRLISRPTRKKKTAIRPSLIHSRSGLEMPKPPTSTVTGICHSRK
jgi:hypothetical protein